MSKLLSAEELQAIRQRAEAATPGPYPMSKRDLVTPMGDGDFLGWDYDNDAITSRAGNAPPTPARGMFVREADARFFEQSQPDVLRLLAHIEAESKVARAARLVVKVDEQLDRHFETCAECDAPETGCDDGAALELAFINAMNQLQAFVRASPVAEPQENETDGP